MLIFSRSRAPWVGFVFILVMVVATILKVQFDSDQEDQAIARDKVTYETFVKEVSGVLGQENPLLKDAKFFEFYRCGILSIREKLYCNRISDEIFNRLDAQQKQALIPILKKHLPQ